MYIDDTIGFSSATLSDGGLHAIAVRTDEPEPASGGLLDREHGEPPALFVEESEDEYAMLRQKDGAGPSNNPGPSGT